MSSPALALKSHTVHLRPCSCTPCPIFGLQRACGPYAPPMGLQESEPQTLLSLVGYQRALRTDESNPACSLCDCSSASSRRPSLQTVASWFLVLDPRIRCLVTMDCFVPGCQSLPSTFSRHTSSTCVSSLLLSSLPSLLLHVTDCLFSASFQELYHSVLNSSLLPKEQQSPVRHHS